MHGCLLVIVFSKGETWFVYHMVCGLRQCTETWAFHKVPFICIPNKKHVVIICQRWVCMSVCYHPLVQCKYVELVHCNKMQVVPFVSQISQTLSQRTAQWRQAISSRQCGVKLKSNTHFHRMIIVNVGLKSLSCWVSELTGIRHKKSGWKKWKRVDGGDHQSESFEVKGHVFTVEWFDVVCIMCIKSYYSTVTVLLNDGVTD